MRDARDGNERPHPGPYRIPRVDAGVGGIIVAVGFIVMGFVSMPIAKWFLLGALVLGVISAVVLHATRKG